MLFLYLSLITIYYVGLEKLKSKIKCTHENPFIPNDLPQQTKE